MEENDHNPPEVNKRGKFNPHEKLCQDIYICSYNVRSLKDESRMIELESALKTVKWDVIGMSEIRKDGYGIEERDWCIFYYFGQTKGHRGVGFLVKKAHKKSIQKFTGFSDRVALLNITIHDTELSIIQVYSPTESSSEENLELFYSDVRKAKENSGQNIIIMGDFNAKIGIPKVPIEPIIGPYGLGSGNERGERLTEFCLEEELVILNTLYKKKLSQRWTWMSPNNTTKNEIDYLLTNKRDYFINFEVLRKITYPSDHRLIRGTLRIKSPKKCRKKFSQNNSLLNTENEQLRFLKNLEKTLEEVSYLNMSTQCLYDYIEISIIESLKKARTNHKLKKCFKLSKEIRELIKKRHTLQLNDNKSKKEKIELKSLYKTITKNIHREYKNYKLDIYESWLQKTGSIKSANKSIRQCKMWIPKINTSEGCSENRKDLVLLATNFYRDLYKKRPSEDVSIDRVSEELNFEAKVEDFSLTEIVWGIRNLNNRKSPGPDSIINEALKIGEKIISGLITILFNKILKEQKVPEQWTVSEIILIYKKGDPSEVSNYRPISLMSSLYKLFSQCLLKRIGSKIDAKQPIEQAGFRSKYSTIDHIHVLSQVIEKYKEFNSPLYIAFVDYRKAFDSISHASIKEALQYHEVEKTYIDIISNIYENCKSKVRLERTGPTFKIERGVRQGDPVSPKIFIAVLELILKDSSWKTRGIKIDGKYLSHLRFADDIALLANTAEELNDMLTTLHLQSIKVGLEINFDKTKVITNNTLTPIQINGQNVEYVNDYLYLGKQLSFREIDSEEVERRIGSAWKRYWSLKHILKSKLPIKLKKKVLDSCVLPCLTYGCQTWCLTEKTANKISICQRTMERSILNLKLSDKVKNTEIRKRTQVTDAIIHVRKLKWKWAGHLSRYEDGRWTKRVTLWRGPSKGKRRVGRPLKRWVDDIQAVAGESWMKKAQDREKWSSLEEAFTRTGSL